MIKRIGFMTAFFFSAFGVLSQPASAGQGKLTQDELCGMGAKYVGTPACADCHEKAARDFKLSTHARISAADGTPGVQGCEACHGPGSLHVDADDDKKHNLIMNPGKNPEACFICHTEKRAEFRLPSHHPVPEGKMSCTDCHSPHGIDARPGIAAGLDDLNETCFKCHKDQRGPFVYAHEALRDGCVTCHRVHGSVNDKMLVARDMNLCLRCHAQERYPSIAGSNHWTSSRLQTGSCYSASCHTAVHGSNFDDHLRY